MDVPAKFADWGKAVGADAAPGLAARLFRSAINLAEERTGALLVVLRDPQAAIPQLLAPGDRIAPVEAARQETTLSEDIQISPRQLKRVLHQLVIGDNLSEIDDSIVESLAAVDGALVTDRSGKLHSFGAILRITSEAVASARAAEGARTVAAVTASFFGPVLKISQDGIVTMYLSGRRVWDL
jgi:DNA integrity scanning protein DisA with diadenylate cyclase activity